MAAQDNNTSSSSSRMKKPSLLGRLRAAVKKVTFLMNFNINQWRIVSSIIHGGGRRKALSSRRMSFNDRLGLTSIMSSPSPSPSNDDNSTWTASAYMTPSYQMSPEETGLQKTRSFPLQRTTSFPEEDDIDKRADLFISNFYRQLKIDRQVSLQLRYKRDTSFDQSPSNFSP